MNTLNHILKKYNITVGREYIINIDQIESGKGLARLFDELGFKFGVEIGTDQGEYADVLLRTIPGLYLTCVDPWKAEAYKSGEQPEGNENQEFFDKRYKETVEKLKLYSQVRIKRATSMEALEDFADNSLDFVYIDGNHDFVNVARDIDGWIKKVRPGGILSGHDFVRYPFRKHNHVKRVVEAYIASYRLFPTFVTNMARNELKRDKFRSWFLVKP